MAKSGCNVLNVFEPGACPRPFDPTLLGKEPRVPIYPVETRVMTEEERKIYGVER